MLARISASIVFHRVFLVMISAVICFLDAFGDRNAVLFVRFCSLEDFFLSTAMADGRTLDSFWKGESVEESLLAAREYQRRPSEDGAAV
ncbi:unnamed protein product [Victoria cruziana]